MMRDGDQIKLRGAELSTYLELTQSEHEPATVTELNAGLLKGIAHWEQREAAGFRGAQTFIGLLRQLLVVDDHGIPPREDEP